MLNSLWHSVYFGSLSALAGCARLSHCVLSFCLPLTQARTYRANALQLEITPLTVTVLHPQFNQPLMNIKQRCCFSDDRKLFSLSLLVLPYYLSPYICFSSPFSQLLCSFTFSLCMYNMMLVWEAKSMQLKSINCPLVYVSVWTYQ